MERNEMMLIICLFIALISMAGWLGGWIVQNNTIVAKQNTVITNNASSIITSGFLTINGDNKAPSNIQSNSYWDNPYFNYGSYMNMLLQSEAFDVVTWAKMNITATANLVLSPNEQLIAEALVPAGNVSYGNIHQNITTSWNGTYIFSVYVMANNSNSVNVKMMIVDNNTPFNVNISNIVNYTASFNITNNTWYRIFVAKNLSMLKSRISVFLATNGSVRAWGAQLEMARTNFTTFPSVYSGAVTTTAINTRTWRTATWNNLYTYGTLTAAGASTLSGTVTASGAMTVGTTLGVSGILTKSSGGINYNITDGIVLVNTEMSNGTISKFSPALRFSGTLNTSLKSEVTNWYLYVNNTNFNNSVFTITYRLSNMTNNTFMQLNRSGNVVMSAYAGAGNDYACFDSTGAIYRSDAACA